MVKKQEAPIEPRAAWHITQPTRDSVALLDPEGVERVKLFYNHNNPDARPYTVNQLLRHVPADQEVVDDATPDGE